MIKTKRELDFYLKADRMMNTGKFELSLKEKVRDLLLPDHILRFLAASRKLDYYSGQYGPVNKALRVKYAMMKNRLGVKCGFSLSTMNIGYGLMIPHYGTIVVGKDNRIGNYAVLHTSTCITDGERVIGDGLYLSTGSIILGEIKIGEHVSVAPHSLVDSDVESDCLVGGIPARKFKDSLPWWERDGEKYVRRVNECEALKRRMLG